MDPRNSPLDELFEGNKEYRVPLYQRLYVWNEKDQWVPLWEDIRAVAQNLIGAPDAKKVGAHFFGAIVLKKSDGFTPDDANVYSVIDGQQRLTTTQLLLSAAADEMGSREPRLRAADRLRELIENPRFADADRRFKMRHGGHNYTKFKKVLGANGDEDRIRRHGGEMAQCYLYFRSAVRDWLNEEDVEQRSNALTTALRTKLKVVAIYLKPNEPEHLIFETLNARSAPLTEWDKIRNYLFHRIDEDEQDDFFLKYLVRFDENWWREDSGRGQDARPRTDRFVDYWLESRLRRPVARSRVFREFKEAAEPRSTEDLVADIELLKSDADYYWRFESGSGQGDDLEALFHERRRQMDLGSFWPFLLGLRRSNLDESARRVVLSTLESWFVRRWIWRHQARGYPDRALELLRRVPKTGKGDETARVIVDRLAESDDASGRWPTDEEVTEAVTEFWMSSRLRRFVLHAVERHITPVTAEKAVPRPEELQIEHLMPVGWTPGKWPLDADSADAKEKRGKWIQTLGNLTLIHGSVNKKMGNAAWVVKQKKILKGSNLFLNKELLGHAPTVWNEEAIRERGEWLAERVCETWPHADALRRRLGRE